MLFPNWLFGFDHIIVSVKCGHYFMDLVKKKKTETKQIRQQQQKIFYFLK